MNHHFVVMLRHMHVHCTVCLHWFKHTITNIYYTSINNIITKVIQNNNNSQQPPNDDKHKTTEYNRSLFLLLKLSSELHLKKKLDVKLN